MNISYSKESTFKSCLLKYKYNYVDKFQVKVDVADVTKKGLVLHETFEHFLNESNVDMTSLEAEMRKLAKTHRLSDEQIKDFDLMKGLERWLKMKNEFIDKFDYKFQEKKYVFDTEEKDKMTMIIDLLLKRRNEWVIVDYKTPKHIDKKLYQDQLNLYRLYLSKLENYPVEKIKTKVFFALAEANKDLPTEDLLVDVTMSDEDLQDLNMRFNLAVAQMKLFKPEAFTDIKDLMSPSFSCTFCPYYNTAPVKEIGYQGCPTTNGKRYKLVEVTKSGTSHS